MQIVLKNVQAIKDYVFDFPDTGIVEFVGDNSNNKSALERVLTAIINVEVKDAEVRTSLINDYEQEALVLILHGNSSLGVKLHAERVKTILQYTPDLSDPKNVITRTLRDGGWEELIREFGFRSYGKGTVCLQTYPTFGPLPFINTSPTINCEIVEDATSDKPAETFCENYIKITYPKASAELKATKQQLNMLQNQIDGLRLYEWNKYQQIGDKLKRLKEVIVHWTKLELEPIELMSGVLPPMIPQLHLEPIELYSVQMQVQLPTLHLDPIPIAVPIPCGMSIEPNENILSEYLDVVNGRCPTCNKPLGEGVHQHD